MGQWDTSKRKGQRIGIYIIYIQVVWDCGTVGHIQKKGTEDGNIYNIHISSVGLWDSGTLPKERDRGWEYI